MTLASVNKYFKDGIQATDLQSRMLLGKTCFQQVFLSIYMYQVNHTSECGGFFAYGVRGIFSGAAASYFAFFGFIVLSTTGQWSVPCLLLNSFLSLYPTDLSYVYSAIPLVIINIIITNLSHISSMPVDRI